MIGLMLLILRRDQLEKEWTALDEIVFKINMLNDFFFFFFNRTFLHLSLFHGVFSLGRCTTPYVTCRWKRISIVLFSRFKKILHGERFADK